MSFFFFFFTTDVFVAVSRLFNLEAGQLQGFQNCTVQPNDWGASQEAEEATEMSRSKDREWKVAGVILRWPSTSLLGPVAADYHERCLSLPLY